MKFAFIAAEKALYPVEVLCAVLEVSRSGYYAWTKRTPSGRMLSDARLRAQITAIHRTSRGTYGSPRVHAELRSKGVRVGKKRVERLMRDGGIQARRKRPFRRTTDSNHDLPIAPNVLDRKFATAAPNQAWVTDVTYIPTGEGWLYLATTIDLFNREVIGHAMAEHMRAELVCDAVELAHHNVTFADDAIFHSDRGSNYTSSSFSAALAEHGARQSVGRTGICYDNAMAESFFGTLKNERVHRTVYPTRERARADIAQYIELRYNSRRLHSGLGYRTPQEVHDAWLNSQAAA